MIASAAILSLGERADVASLPAILEAVDSFEFDVRLAAVTVLSRFTGPDVLKALLHAMDSEDDDVVLAALTCVGDMKLAEAGDRAFKVGTDILAASESDPSAATQEFIVSGAAKAMLALRDSRCFTLYIWLVGSSDPALRADAARTIESIADKIAQPGWVYPQNGGAREFLALQARIQAWYDEAGGTFVWQERDKDWWHWGGVFVPKKK
jgi:HEAT repeat protein